MDEHPRSAEGSRKQWEDYVIARFDDEDYGKGEVSLKSVKAAMELLASYNPPDGVPWFELEE